MFCSNMISSVDLWPKPVNCWSTIFSRSRSISINFDRFRSISITLNPWDRDRIVDLIFWWDRDRHDLDPRCHWGHILCITWNNIFCFENISRKKNLQKSVSPKSLVSPNFLISQCQIWKLIFLNAFKTSTEIEIGQSFEGGIEIGS